MFTSKVFFFLHKSCLEVIDVPDVRVWRSFSDYNVYNNALL